MLFRLARRLSAQTPSTGRPLNTSFFQLDKQAHRQRLLNQHKSNRLAQKFRKEQFESMSPVGPNTLHAHIPPPGCDIKFVKARGMMYITVEEEGDTPEEVLMLETSKLQGLVRKNQVYGQLFDIIGGGQSHRCLMTNWAKDLNEQLVFASFKRYRPGHPNEVMVLVEAHGVENNRHILTQEFNFRVVAPAINVLCYNDAPPVRLKVSCQYITPERPLFMADLQNLLPRGCYIDPKYYPEIAVEIYRIDFIDEFTKVKLIESIKKDGAKQKEKEKKDAQDKAAASKAATGTAGAATGSGAGAASGAPGDKAGAASAKSAGSAPAKGGQKKQGKGGQDKRKKK